MQSMIFAAGLGTRLKPLTDTMPKALVKVGGQPLIEHTIKRLKNAGCDHTVVNVHHFANQIVDYLHKHNFGIDVSISDESEELLDTGGGIRKASPLFDLSRPILIHNVDILSNVNLKDFYARAVARENAEPIDALLLVSARKTKRYLIFNDEMHLVGWMNVENGEVKSPFEEVKRLTFTQPYGESATNRQHGYRLFAFSGIHILNPSVFKKMDECPKKFPIMDFYLKYAKELQFKGYAKNDLQLMDVGKIDTLKDAEDFLISQSSKD
ncbi:nucleotidyltransferase family protein [Prevotella sp. HUN102]|uniref:nucleotidyltransferase family protein n=1 Tax=Prevotella sp. HUN102 TaxID=1392486 RepID=UPI00048FF772|nr:nucleotidyltransferase family protein [Prevotella sp. HUN102]